MDFRHEVNRIRAQHAGLADASMPIDAIGGERPMLLLLLIISGTVLFQQSQLRERRRADGSLCQRGCEASEIRSGRGLIHWTHAILPAGLR